LQLSFYDAAGFSSVFIGELAGSGGEINLMRLIWTLQDTMGVGMTCFEWS
jgi:hypothetical protein